jgi:hypothetical protein
MKKDFFNMRTSKLVDNSNQRRRKFLVITIGTNKIIEQHKRVGTVTLLFGTPVEASKQKVVNSESSLVPSVYQFRPSPVGVFRRKPDRFEWCDEVLARPKTSAKILRRGDLQY